MKIRTAAFAGLALATLGGCKTQGDIVVDEGVGITALRTACPAVGIPDYTGDVTLFSPAGTVTAEAIDVTAAMTNVRTTCDECGRQDLRAGQLRRLGPAPRHPRGPHGRTALFRHRHARRQRGAVQAGRHGDAEFRRRPGARLRQRTAGAFIDRAEATLPDDIRERITRKRKAGEADAAVDPLAEPEVRAAVARATFELLVGFQLTQDQLAYNATR